MPRSSAAREPVDLLNEGVARFNRGLFFEAHEAWEEAWKPSRGAHRQFLQGLIQAAAALLHAERGNLHGAQSLYVRAREKLDKFEDEYEGIALGEFRADLGSYFALVLKGEQSDREPVARPMIRRTTEVN